MFALKRKNKHKKTKEKSDELACRNLICSRCQTGKDCYELDKSEMCPYICCRENDKCGFYRPLQKG